MRRIRRKSLLHSIYIYLLSVQSYPSVTPDVILKLILIVKLHKLPVPCNIKFNREIRTGCAVTMMYCTVGS